MLLLAGGLTSCQYDPFARSYTLTQPVKADVVGLYEFEWQNVESKLVDWKNRKGYKPINPRIEINADGSFVVHDLPDFEDGDYEIIGWIEQQGSWKIIPTGTVDFGSGNKKQTWGIHLEGVSGDFEFVGFTGQAAPYGLIVGFGDPDLGKAVTFSKTEVQ